MSRKTVLIIGNWKKDDSIEIETYIFEKLWKLVCPVSSFFGSDNDRRSFFFAAFFRDSSLDTETVFSKTEKNVRKWRKNNIEKWEEKLIDLKDGNTYENYCWLHIDILKRRVTIGCGGFGLRRPAAAGIAPDYTGRMRERKEAPALRYRPCLRKRDRTLGMSLRAKL